MREQVRRLRGIQDVGRVLAPELRADAAEPAGPAGEEVQHAGVGSGADISVTEVIVGGNRRGQVSITPRQGVTIEKFGVGGQEFYVDDVCFW